MQSKDKQRAEQAKRRNANTAVNNDENYNRATQRGEGVGIAGQEDLDELGNQLGDTWSDYVQFRAFQRMAQNLQTGARGDDLQQFVTALKYGVSRAIASSRAEIGQELDPKYLLQSSSEPATTSTESFWDDSATTEAEIVEESE